MIKAYILGTISTTSPKLLGVLLAVLQRKKNLQNAISEVCAPFSVPDGP